MILLDEHEAEMKRVQELMKSARGKRLYDLQTYYKRLKKDYFIARRFINETIQRKREL